MKILNIERASTNLHTANFYKFLEFLPSGFRILLDLRIFISAHWDFGSKFLSSTQTSSVQQKNFTFSAPKVRHFETKNPSVQQTPQFNTSSFLVLNWGMCLTERFLMSNWRFFGVELRDVLNWGLFVLNWGIWVPKRGVPCAELMCWTEGYSIVYPEKSCFGSLTQTRDWF